MAVRVSALLAALAFVLPSAELAAACTAVPPIAATTTTVSAPLEAALDSVSAEHIKSDIFFIASDELGGRDTPSVGLKIAARFIRSRLERLGWQPGAPNGFLFPYKLKQRRLDAATSHVRIGAGPEAHDLRLGRDYFLPSSFDIQPLDVSGGVVFCGSSKDVDFGTAKVEGRWALCFDGGVEARRLRSPAKKAGALGVILAPGPDYDGEPYAERFAAELARQREGAVSYPSSDERPRELFPQLYITRESVEHLFALAHAQAAPAVGSDLGVNVSDTRKLEGEDGSIEVENVCAFWPGSDPVLGKEVVIISAHYDHVGTRNGVVYNGADDNGTGTCGLLAIAEALTHYGPMRRSVMLIWVSGEEKGLWGSKAWVEHPWLPEGCRAIADINIDMVGRNAPDKLLITPTSERPKDYNGLVRMAEALSPSEGFPKLGSADDYYTRSDHANFAKLGIPVTFLFSDVHEDYHKPGDKPEKIDNDKVRRVMRLVLRMLDRLQADQLEL